MTRAETDAVAADEHVESLYAATPKELDAARSLARKAHAHAARARKTHKSVLASVVSAGLAVGDRFDAAASGLVLGVADAADKTIDGAVAFVAGTEPPSAPPSAPPAPRKRVQKAAQPDEVARQEDAEAKATREALARLENRPVRDREEVEAEWLSL